MPVRVNLHNLRWRRWLEFGLGLIALLFMVRTLGVHWGTIAEHLTHLNWPFLGLAWLGFVAYFGLRALAWQSLLAALGSPMSFFQAVRIWCFAEAQRYIPGNVWSLVGRAYLGEKAGMPRQTIVVSLVLEMMLLLGSAALFGVIAVNIWPSQELHTLRWLTLAVIPIGWLLFSPDRLFQTINRLLHFLKKKPLPLSLVPRQIWPSFLFHVLAWLAYGGASFFVLRAFIGTPSISSLWLIALFVIAWLVGYVSVLPPMGLGVREGVVIAALTPLLSSGVASLIAIASRLWLIVTELSVLGGLLLVGGIRHRKNNRARLKTFWQHHAPEILLALGILLFIGYFSTYTFLRHYHFISSRFDLGIMDQTVWNTAHGRFFQLTQPDGTATISRFAIHADIFLVLLAPFYWVFASPYTLLGLQVVVIALGALPLFLLAKNILVNRWLALAIAGSYLLFPPIHRAIIFDFHAVMLVNSLLIFAFYFLHQRRYGWFFLFAVLTLATKETMAFLVICLGIYLLVVHKQWRVGLSAMLISIGWFYALLWHLMPGARSDGTAHFALSYYEALGNSPTKILETLFFKPQVWLHTLLTREHFQYLLFFLVPTGFLALASPLILIAIPELLVNLLSNNPVMATYYFQYISGITPFVFIAMVFGAKKMIDLLSHTPWKARTIPIVVTYIIGASLISLWLWSPLPGMRWPDTKVWSAYLPGEAYLRNLEKTMPESATVSATNNLAPHFSHREKIYPFPLGIGEADYILTQEGEPFEIETVEQISAKVRDLEKDSRYRKIYQSGKVEVFEKIINPESRIR